MYKTKRWCVPWLNLLLACLPQISYLKFSFHLVKVTVLSLSCSVPISWATNLREKYTFILCCHWLVRASCAENTLPGVACLLGTSSCSSSKYSRNSRTSLLSSFLLLHRHYAFPPSPFLRVLVTTQVEVPLATSSRSLFVHLPVVSSSCSFARAWHFRGISSFLAASWSSLYFFCIPNSHS